MSPAMPLVLADSAFLAALSEVEALVSSLRIVDSATAQQAANLTGRLTSAGKKLNETRLALKRPFATIQDEIEKTARAPLARIENLKNVLKNAQLAWDEQQKREAELAEKRRLDELARLEELKKVEEAAENARLTKLAEEEAAKAKPQLPDPEIPVEDFDLGDGFEVEAAAPPPPPPPPAPSVKTAIQQQIDAVRHAPAVVVVRSTGVRFKTTISPTVEDVNKIPDMFVVKTANLQAIKATFCTGWKEGEPLPVCAGIKFTPERTVDSSGKKSGFGDPHAAGR